MTKRLVMCAIAVLSFSVPASAAVITFEDLGVAPGAQFDPPDGATTTSGGFDFVAGPLSSINDLHFANNNSNTIGGTTELLSHEQVIMSRAGGGTFTLNQFLWGSSFLEMPSFRVIGTISGGGTTSQIFLSDQDENTFELFSLNATFTNLESVIFEHLGGVTGIQNIDDIAVDNVNAAAVPEPGTLLLFGLGAAALTRRFRSSLS